MVSMCHCIWIQKYWGLNWGGVEGGRRRSTRFNSEIYMWYLCHHSCVLILSFQLQEGWCLIWTDATGYEKSIAQNAFIVSTRFQNNTKSTTNGIFLPFEGFERWILFGFVQNLRTLNSICFQCVLLNESSWFRIRVRIWKQLDFPRVPS